MASRSSVLAREVPAARPSFGAASSVFLAAAACSPPELLRPLVRDAPDSVAFVAVLPFDEGKVQSGTALLPLGDSASYDFDEHFAEHNRVLIAGWSRDQLAGATLAEMRSNSVRPAQPSEPLLPIPTWELDSANGDILALPSPELTTGWLGECSASELVVTPSCVAAACEIRASFDGCGMEIDGSDCELGRLSARLDSRVPGRVTQSEVLERCTRGGSPSWAEW
ncbi:MAG: hypothetical protein HY791_34300 [Deltaproteobacteria bacterium]|nr:hypothetical protein [Deltaproteobacteria bacterium]